MQIRRWAGSLSSVLVVSGLVLGCSKDGASPAAVPSTEAAAATGAPEPAQPGAGAASEAARAQVGQPAPDFELPSLAGEKVKLSAFKGKTVVLEWFNPDCPFVRQAHTSGSLAGTGSREQKNGVVWLAVNSGAPGKQGHGKETNEAGKEQYGIDYPILFDEDGRVGRMYGATNTPHMYVIDTEGTLVYMGALDNSRSGDPEDAEPELINYVANALKALADKQPVATAQTNAWGCGVKYAK
jgi:peroxiredoxin